VDVELLHDPAAFLDAAGPLLLDDEARHSLILGLTGLLRDQPGRFAEWRLWLVRDGGRALAAALRTPPYRLVLARPESEAALEALVEGVGEELPGVVGAEPEVERFAALWARRHGVHAQRGMRQGIYALERLRPVPAAPGRARPATAPDVPLLLDWWQAFEAEALAEPAPEPESARRGIEQRLAAEDGGLRIWEDGGPVAFAGYGGATPSGIRIGPVYTPPALRRRGYASALVAGLSAELLAAGRRFCFLYTDLANSTANGIYRRMGYELVCESAEVAFAA
jgi:uncharacterized protein